MIERKRETLQARRKMLSAIGETSDSIRALFQALALAVEGLLPEVDPTDAESTERFLQRTLTRLNSTLYERTRVIQELVDTSARLATSTAIEIDQAVFGIEAPVVIGGGAPEVAKTIKNQRFGSGFRLSDSIWPTDKINRDRFYQTIQKGIRGGNALKSTVEEIVSLRSGRIEERLPALIRKAESSARDAAQGLPEARKRFQKIAKQIRRQLTVRKVGEYARPVQQGLADLGTRRGLEAFIDRIDRAVRKGSLELIREATDELLVKRSEYNSIRAARTMSSRAFQKTAQQERKNRPWIIGERWNLSASHPRYDECDLRAKIDLGLGEGIYPKGSAPFDHPNGLCFLTDVIDDEYLDRGEEMKIEWKDGYMSLIEGVSPGSPQSKVANRNGRKQNLKKIANEIKKVGAI